MSSKTFCPHGVWDEYPCDECGTDLAASVATYNLERAVIEAAEAQSRCHEDWADDNKNREVEMEYRAACLRTCKRVRELQEARDET